LILVSSSGRTRLTLGSEESSLRWGIPARPRCPPCSGWSGRPTTARPESRSPGSAKPTTTRSRSTANGSWRQWDTTFGPRIAWVKPDALYLAGKDGKVKVSPDAGKTWQEAGSIGAGPKELTFSAQGELYASVAGGAIRRSADGGKTWTEVVKLG